MVQSTPLGNPGDSVFDGDEMNLHMAQDPESESELRNLAAVPYQIISPSNNAPIIGIYQDSVVGSRGGRDEFQRALADHASLLVEGEEQAIWGERGQPSE